MENRLFGRDIVSISDLSRDDIESIIKQAATLKELGAGPYLSGKLIASCFFEASTRTRLSFEAAVQTLGGRLIGFSDSETTSAKKGEKLSDSIRMIAAYADAILLRHPHEGAARMAAEVAETPVINCGDGANQHPTQTLLDLFSIAECQGRLDGLNIALVGDLKYGRTVHSLALALAHFKPHLHFVAPDALRMPSYIENALADGGVSFEYQDSLEDVVPKVDVLYLTRVQKERLDPTEYMHVASKYVLTVDGLCNAQPHLRVMHPLPRVDEIHPAVDATEHAYYFEQAKNGLYVRQALLSLVMNESLE